MQEADGDELSLAILVPAASEDGATGGGPEFEMSLTGHDGALSARVPQKDMAKELLALNHPRVKRFTSVVYLHLDANEMSGTSIPKDENPRMRFDGSGLASTLAWMKGAAEDELAQITLDLARVVPREPRRPRLVLLDDIDRGLHIEAQAKLVQVLRDLLTIDPELQIVCTTHSPYLLDLFEPAEVRVLALDANRHTHALSLTAHPEFTKWKFGTQTGELWAALGNAWVTVTPEPHP